MAEIVFHPSTQRALEQFIARPSHAIVLLGQRGMGKGSVAQYIAAALLDVPTAKLQNQPYLKVITAGTETSISIETIRELEHFLSRKVPGGNRVVLIEDAHLLTPEAQNALLKTLEEPPLGSYLVLTATQEQSLLPTLRSRVTVLPLAKPEKQTLYDHFQTLGYAQDEISRNIQLADGLPGLLAALLDAQETHPLVAAVATAREVLQKSVFERLCMVDALSKQKTLCQDTLQMLEQMAHVALSGPNPSPRWKRVLEQAYLAREQLSTNAQPKLVLTSCMLNL